MVATVSTATIYRSGPILFVESAPLDVFSGLHTTEHRIATDKKHGTHLRAIPGGLYDDLQANAGVVAQSDDDATPYITMAGLEPVVRYMLDKHGYDVQDPRPIKQLPAPDIDTVREHSVVAHGVLELAQQFDRGLVYRRPKVDLACLIAQIALAYPRISIVIVTTRVDEASELAARLRTWLPKDVKLITAGKLHCGDERIVVGTPKALLGGCMDIERHDRLIVVDAVEILGKDGTTLLNAARNARLLGLLPMGRMVARRDLDHLRGYFGFEEVLVPAHGYRPLPVDVVFEKLRIGHITSDVGTAEFYRQRIWQNPIFNRQISRLARDIQNRDRKTLRRLYRQFALQRRARLDRIAILVENVEHGIAVARQLPGWRLVTAGNVNLKGVSRANRETFAAATRRSGEDVPAIYTLAAAEQLDPRQIDVLIRADAGNGLPPIKGESLIIPHEDSHRLLLIDLDDRRHLELGRLTRQRKRAYRERGWYAPGADPVEERVKDFLATRPQLAQV